LEKVLSTPSACASSSVLADFLHPTIINMGFLECLPLDYSAGSRSPYGNADEREKEKEREMLRPSNNCMNLAWHG
jgi:hypothetical protein